jgi:hypothetical protein
MTGSGARGIRDRGCVFAWFLGPGRRMRCVFGPRENIESHMTFLLTCRHTSSESMGAAAVFPAAPLQPIATDRLLRRASLERRIEARHAERPDEIAADPS